jgi:dsRNA-specific ribonuclease
MRKQNQQNLYKLQSKTKTYEHTTCCVPKQKVQPFIFNAIYLIVFCIQTQDPAFQFSRNSNKHIKHQYHKTHGTKQVTQPPRESQKRFLNHVQIKNKTITQTKGRNYKKSTQKSTH